MGKEEGVGVDQMAEDQMGSRRSGDKPSEHWLEPPYVAVLMNTHKLCFVHKSAKYHIF